MSQNPYQENPFQAPAGPSSNAPPTRPSGPMGPMEILTSFEGRIPRSTFWLWSIILSFAALALMLGGIFLSAALLGEDNPAGLIFGLIVYFPTIYCSLAIYAKRWHDRDKSGWWSLISFVPYIGGFWMLIECGFLSGTPGRNQYGNNPLR